jgi:8-oxo-dGTP pyrophosphatase MutT (NUDIX family)
MQSDLLFQYCQKLVVFSANKQSVLLARRKSEIDYDGVFSFIGGKLETTDTSLLAGMQREKNEELSEHVTLRVLPSETYNILFRKKDGNTMVLPHIPAIYVSGDITLNDEYSEYQWVLLTDLARFEPKIESILPMTQWAAQKLAEASDQDLIEI